MLEQMEFRPARPPLRDLVPIAFVALLFLILAPGIIARPAPWPIVGLTGTALLVVGGLWLRLRHRFPGDPTLRVNREGMSYVRGGRERGFKWTDIAAIRVDSTLNEMRFIPASGERPIVMHNHMVAEDGRPFAMLIEDYWQPPKARRTQARPLRSMRR